MAPLIFTSPPRPPSPRRKLGDAWLTCYELDHRRHLWNRQESQGDPAVRQFFEAVRDQLRGLGALANVDPVIGAIYVVDAVREKPGFVVWSVDADTGTWHGSLNDAREINLQGTGGMAPGAAAAFASLGPPPSGFFDTMARGKLYRGQQDVAMSVYGPGGTGVHLLDYPERMFDTIDADFSGIDAYDVAAVAAAMFAGMDAKKLTFSGTSNITKADRAGQEHTQTPVEVTPVLVEKWRQLGRDGGSWRCQRIGGTAFHMPAPV